MKCTLCKDQGKHETGINCGAENVQPVDRQARTNKYRTIKNMETVGRDNMKKKLIAIMACLLVIMMLPTQAMAITYNLYTNSPYDGVPSVVVNTSTTTVTMSVTGTRLPHPYYSGHIIERGVKVTGFYLENAHPYYGQWLPSGFILGDSSISNTYAPPPPSRQYVYKTLMTGLTPGTSYILTDQETGATRFDIDDNSISYTNYTIYTEPNAPTSPTFTNITQNGADVNWTTNGNGSATTYKLYRSMSASGPWTLLYNGAGTFYADSGLVPNTTYYYVVKSFVPGSTEKSSEIISFTTAQDPAVAAATAAKNSADAAMIASQKAEQATYTMVDKVTAMEGKIDELSKLTQDRQAPVILAFRHSLDKIRVTRNSVTPFLLSATDDRSDTLQYRYQVNGGAFSDWQGLETSVVDLSLGLPNGFKQIVVEVKDESGKTTSASTSIFKL